MEDVGSRPAGPVRLPGVLTPAFLTLLGASFVAIVSFQLLTASLPLYAVRLGADDAVLGLMGGAIALMSLVARPWVGWWLDAGGAVLALQAGMLMFALAGIPPVLGALLALVMGRKAQRHA
jgi:MFS family permease